MSKKNDGLNLQLPQENFSTLKFTNSNLPLYRPREGWPLITFCHDRHFGDDNIH